jgi:hypothetical protein
VQVKSDAPKPVVPDILRPFAGSWAQESDLCAQMRLSLNGVGYRKLGDGDGCSAVTVFVVESAVILWGRFQAPDDGGLVAVNLGEVVGHRQ